MKKYFLLPMLLLALGGRLQAQEEQTDSLKNVRLEEVIVSATRAGQSTPVSYSNVSVSDIKKQSTARNIPAVLQVTPSLVSFTEDGLGVGNTYFRIRGTDATRINVTLNGMPLNNPETQEVFWVNLPDLSSSLQSVQIQRGIGTSTNGSAAFGASVSLKTTGARTNAYGEASTSVGSYNTFLSNIAAGTGILKNGLSLDTRYSRVLGDGYVRNGKVNHANLYLALSHYMDRQLLRLTYLRGVQHTGITWEGVSPEQMNDEEYGRRYNPAGEYYDEAGNRLYYDNETDNYYSDIVQLLFSRELSDALSLNASFSYNHGFGYYENYKMNRKFSDFGLEPQVVDDVTYKRSDIIRQKCMDNDFYVANLGLEYFRDALKLTFGTMYSYYNGAHFGKLPWVKYSQNIAPDYEWYRNMGRKSEFSMFAKSEYQITDYLSAFGDIQYRHVNYSFDGIDDDLAALEKDLVYDFINPKAGLFYRINKNNSLYASVAMAQREPIRSDLKEAIKGDSGNMMIVPERMIDYELGYRFANNRGLRLGANLYLMDYYNQMVQTGKLNDNGYKLMENVKDSYRAGIELEMAVPLLNNKLRLDGNATISTNKIKNYTAYFDHYDTPDNYEWVGQISKDYASTNISYSPDLVGFFGITYMPTSHLYINLQGKYVGKQFLDNTSDDEKSIDAYFVSNLSAGYTFSDTRVGEISVQFFVNNLFNEKYIANGWAATDTFATGENINWIGYYPQATRNYMARVSISF